MTYAGIPSRFEIMRMRRLLQPLRKDDRYAVAIKDLGVSDRTIMVLYEEGIETVADLYAYRKPVLSIPNFGRKCYADLNAALTAKGWKTI